jgi:Aspartyl protease
MLKTKLFTFLVLLSFSKTIFGQEKEIVIPFQLTEYNNISVQAILNEKDTVNLMFHTAASSVTLTEDAVKKITSLIFNNNTEGVKSWGGETNAARLSENNSLQIGAMQFKGISIWENKYSGQKTDGKFGIDLFKDHVIKLDFEKNRLIITSALPKDIHKYEKLKLILENDMMFLEAGCKTDTAVFTNRFLIHSGYSGAILFDDKFAGDNKLGETLKITGEKELKDSYGNTLKTIKAVLPVLKIGTVELYNVPVGFFSGALGRQKMSVVGGDILKRFQIIIDSKRAYIYLKANKLKKEKYTNH